LSKKEKKAVAKLTGKERADEVQRMFARIAHRYDLMNRLMTGGRDKAWRREVIRRAGLPPRGRLLDIGAGTGDLALEALRQQPGAQAVAADFTIEMMRAGRARFGKKSQPPSGLYGWLTADALNLPFPDQSFDAVVSGFLLRNVTDIRQALAEQYRVLKPGGRLVALDTTPPPRNLLLPFVRFHLHTVIPTLGKLVIGSADAYHYLPDSTENFLRAEQLAARLAEVGFVRVGFRRIMLSTIAIHWGTKVW
jgi:demethylmenaquinone methyltransferase/2-methoxy-6-polyprenyl-1,4-benzoquinol methylase